MQPASFIQTKKTHLFFSPLPSSHGVSDTFICCHLAACTVHCSRTPVGSQPWRGNVSSYSRHRLRRGVRSSVREIVEAQLVQEGVRDVLRALQMRAAGDIWQLRGVPMLRRNHNAQGAAQMPMNSP
ncbi:hypothetical protein HPP92_020384 [Vanilla planifolia]|uniref:Uncharacterized protein n=1 Tax=Vanilla planifolia TaxID=51239 RepID=A0A835PZM0_VANPL|nr:hypothetical protein HPP92_020384 [Vanilla planifolia]